jgi:hypothetical protein
MGVLYINFTELVSLNILRKIGEEVSTSWCISQLQPFIQYSNKNNETIKRALVIRWDKSPFTRLKAVQITLCYILARCAEKLSDKTIHDVAFMNNYIVESHTEIIGRDQYDEYRTDTNDRWLLSYFGLFAKIIAESEVRRRKGTNSNYSVWEFPRDSSDHSSFYPGKIKDRLAREEAETIKKELVQTGKNVIILLTPS